MSFSILAGNENVACKRGNLNLIKTHSSSLHTKHYLVRRRGSDVAKILVPILPHKTQQSTAIRMVLQIEILNISHAAKVRIVDVNLQ
jgi:hypothetical protein